MQPHFSPVGGVSLSCDNVPAVIGQQGSEEPRLWCFTPQYDALDVPESREVEGLQAGVQLLLDPAVTELLQSTRSEEQEDGCHDAPVDAPAGGVFAELCWFIGRWRGFFRGV